MSGNIPKLTREVGKPVIEPSVRQLVHEDEGLREGIDLIWINQGSRLPGVEVTEFGQVRTVGGVAVKPFKGNYPGLNRD